VNVSLPTNSPGTFTLNAFAQDVAGNTTLQPFSYTVVANTAADVDVIELGPLTVKSGSNATFIVGAWNNGPGPAYNVSVSSTLPAGETLVSANFALVTCTLGGCSAPSGGASCTTTTSSFSCNVPVLPVVKKGAKSFTGIGVKVVTTVSAVKGTTLKNTATANASNLNPDTDNVFTWCTKVY